MKKKIFKSLLAIACLLCSTNASAYDFEVDGIYYDVVSLGELTCKVTKSNSKYSGDIVIPATVNYANRTLTVVEIESEVFRSCENLTGITIPNTISSIGNYMFRGCSKLGHVTIEDGNTILELGYNYNGYDYCGLFYDCPIESLYLGRNLSYISDSSHGHAPFAKKGIKEVTIGNSVTSIGENAFYNCSKLTSLTIPNSVTSIGSSAFSGCSGLTSLYSLNTTPPKIISNNFTTNQYMTLNVFVPQEALEAYQSADSWKDFWNLQGFDATGLENVKAESGNAVYYDLRGNRHNAPKRGLNVINGKKVIIK